jgi:hypothetical protein
VQEADGVQQAAGRNHPSAVPTPADDLVSVRLAVEEVKQLWWFFDGAIMDPHVRHRLWRSWGFCSRHAWAHAVVENELRYLPHGTVVLYEDLLTRAIVAIRRRGLRFRPPEHRLVARDECMTCSYVQLPRESVDISFIDRTKRAREHARFGAFAGDTRRVWQPRACSACLGGNGPLCRPHLLQRLAPPTGWEALSDQLVEVAGRLGRFGESMRWRGPEATPADRSALIETLGWFAGWRCPSALTGLECNAVDAGGRGWDG